MVKNRIRVMLAARDTTALKVTESIPGMTKVAMSYIVQGVSLPTREGMEAMCKALQCQATDLYDEAELDLNVTREAKPGNQKRGMIAVDGRDANNTTIPICTPESPVRIKECAENAHEGQERIRFWLKPEEKAALVKAVEGLGYHSLTEWMREMYRYTIKQYAMLKLDGKLLHDLIPPFKAPEVPATDKS